MRKIVIPFCVMIFRSFVGIHLKKNYNSVAHGHCANSFAETIDKVNPTVTGFFHTFVYRHQSFNTYSSICPLKAHRLTTSGAILLLSTLNDKIPS